MLEWLGDSLKVLRNMPEDVQDVIGYGLDIAQQGGYPKDAKPLIGKGLQGVYEIKADHDGNAYRGVYVTKLAERIYVLHVFQKKSKQGIATPKKDMDIIRARLRMARELAKDE